MTETESRIYGKNLICVCVNEASDGDINGVLWTPYEEDSLPFNSGYEMVMLMDRLYDNWDFPQRTTSYRSFGQKDRSRDYHNPNSIRKREPIRSLKTYRGEKATFIVHVKFRQNSSWQGQVLWSEKKKKVHFRSALELLKLMSSALEQTEN
ncbi:hypothetical protein [Butyrivibrio sp. JL13D10]|uniref:hypothetical protein n=1 Tax=Butyrivibrio sp. JL13D10 TaxID=3236815 RepID=UPI0038B68197